MKGEFQRIFGCKGNSENVAKMAKRNGVTILRKGPVDIIADSNEQVHENETGTPHMSVGGTGDALAGIVSGFLAQGLTSFEACQSAAYFLGKCGEDLATSRHSFSASDMLQRLPYIFMS